MHVVNGNNSLGLTSFKVSLKHSKPSLPITSSFVSKTSNKPRQIKIKSQPYYFKGGKYPNEDYGNYEDYTTRIKKTLYYGRLPTTDRPSFPVTGVLVDKFGEFCMQDSFDQLNLHNASSICYDACVTPCSVIVALLYLDRLRTQNPEYLSSTSSSQVFIVALMVASKYLYDDGEEEEVINDEWATSAAMLLTDLNCAEREFLAAIDWNLYVDVTSFMDGLMNVETIVAHKEGTTRGFFIYSDMVTLSNSLRPVWSSFFSLVGSTLIVCIVSYTATVCVVIVATLLSRQYALHVANQMRYNLLPDYESPFASNMTVSLPETAKPLQSLCEIQQLDPVQVELEEPSEDKGTHEKVVVESGSSFSRFNALRTFTTALLLASSKYESPADANYFAASGCAFGCPNALCQPFIGEDFRCNLSVSDWSFDNGANKELFSFTNSREHRSVRRGWRKISMPDEETVRPQAESRVLEARLTEDRVPKHFSPFDDTGNDPIDLSHLFSPLTHQPPLIASFRSRLEEPLVERLDYPRLLMDSLEHYVLQRLFSLFAEAISVRDTSYPHNRSWFGGTSTEHSISADFVITKQNYTLLDSLQPVSQWNGLF